ncbi:MAG TPA: adenylate/guanylate cyclase domain-containing protein [Acidimicrobiia bacterium]|nr:adenylate/guanylate cyclase domain-containing protein [Acidimicrobiia bacterium]
MQQPLDHCAGVAPERAARRDSKYGDERRNTERFEEVVPKTRYAKSGDVNVAYQVFGDGPRDIVHVPGFVSNVELMWEDPGMARFLERLASFSRLIVFDKRGTGLSDPVPADDLPSLEVRISDLTAVMDAAGSRSATIFGHSEGGAMSLLFAATHPERAEALILMGSRVSSVGFDDLAGPTPEQWNEYAEDLETTWGSLGVEGFAPSRADDDAFCEWFKRYQRLSASPRTAATLSRMNSQIDVRSILPAVRVPTLLLYRSGDPMLAHGRYVAERVEHARIVELPGADHFFWAGETTQMLDEIEEFVTGHRVGRLPDRVLATVMFTDIVDSTDRAVALGDRKWSDLLKRHDDLVRSQLAAWRGREINTTGDGFLATFDGPARGIRAGKSIAETVKPLGIDVRVGLHTGEVEVVGDDVAGLTVHIASRVSALAGPSEVFVSRTVRDLVAGSGIEFSSRGTHALKGIPDDWEIYAAH